MKGLTENVSFAIVDFLVCKRGRAQLNREKDLYKNSLVFVFVIWKGGSGGERGVENGENQSLYYEYEPEYNTREYKRKRMGQIKKWSTKTVKEQEKNGI